MSTRELRDLGEGTTEELLVAEVAEGKRMTRSVSAKDKATLNWRAGFVKAAAVAGLSGNGLGVSNS